MPIMNAIQAVAVQALKKHKDGRHKPKYSPLSTRKRQIRVLVLGPGRWNDELSAELRTVNIDEPHLMRYEAVSHACTITTGELKPIKVSTARRIWVQPTIAVMLQHLRYRDENRTLWVEQCCVNQDDLAEKSAQALMVSDIFKASERAVVFLGPDGGDSGGAFSLLEDLGWMVQFDFENMRMRPSAAGIDDPSWADPSVELPYDQEGVWSVYELIYRTWFGRLGSLQEIAAKSAHTTVVCGSRTMTWDLLRTGLACFANKPRVFIEGPDSPAEMRFARRYDMVLLLCRGNKVYALSDLLEQSRKFSCANPLDRVYSILSLAVDVDPSAGLVPNYSLTKAELYREIILHHMTNTSTANMLTSCEGTPASFAAGEMPSWVPDWTVKRVANAMPLHFASSHSEAHVDVDGDVLRAHAVRCGSVDSAINLFSDFVPLTRALAAVHRCAPPDTLTADYPGARCSLLEAYCATLAWGLFDRLHAPPIESYPNLEASIAALRRLLTSSEPPACLGSVARGTADVDLLTFATHITGSCKGRAVFGTSAGLIGLAPKEVQPDDEVWVLLGCDVPLILRPCSGGSRYRIIGDCYVHGLMTGEALLGQLPPDCSLLLDASDGADSGGSIVVRYPAPGTLTALPVHEPEDPRLQILRDALVAAGTDAASMATEELLEPAMLRAAGVAVQQISLI